jgi:hypothetical protein
LLLLLLLLLVVELVPAEPPAKASRLRDTCCTNWLIKAPLLLPVLLLLPGAAGTAKPNVCMASAAASSTSRQ